MFLTLGFSFDRVEIIVGKAENASQQYFLLFKLLQKPYPLHFYNLGMFGKEAFESNTASDWLNHILKTWECLVKKHLKVTQLLNG